MDILFEHICIYCVRRYILKYLHIYTFDVFCFKKGCFLKVNLSAIAASTGLWSWMLGASLHRNASRLGVFMESWTGRAGTISTRKKEHANMPSGPRFLFIKHPSFCWCFVLGCFKQAIIKWSSWELTYPPNSQHVLVDGFPFSRWEILAHSSIPILVGSKLMQIYVVRRGRCRCVTPSCNWDFFHPSRPGVIKWDPFWVRSNLMQIYGQFWGDFPYKSALFGLGIVWCPLPGWNRDQQDDMTFFGFGIQN